jgi:hypothetical protein
MLAVQTWLIVFSSYLQQFGCQLAEAHGARPAHINGARVAADEQPRFRLQERIRL